MAAAQQALARPAGRRALQPRASRAGQRLGARRRRRQALALDVGALGDALAGDASTFADALGELPAAARYGAFAALYCSSALVFFPPTAVLSVGAGALWGPAKGVAAVSVSSTLAACVAFVAARSALRPFAARVAGGALERLERSVERVGAARAVVLARLTPVLPYELSNYAFGLCEDVPLPTFALCSWAAMLPVRAQAWRRAHSFPTFPVAQQCIRASSPCNR